MKNNHPNRSRRCRPREIMRAVAGIYPDAWSRYDQARRDRGRSLPDWPDWCFCPMAMAYAIASHGAPVHAPPPDMLHVAALAAMAPWRMSQVIYQFDPELAESLVTTPVDKIPTEVVYGLPQWCVYVDTTNLELPTVGPIAGFFAHLEYDVNQHHPELRLLVDMGSDNLLGMAPMPLHIDKPTLVEAIQRTKDEARRHAVNQGFTMALGEIDRIGEQESIDAIAPLLSLVLYLCSDQPDTDRRPPDNPSPVKTRRGWKLFPASNPTEIRVGANIGAKIRSAAKDQSAPKATDQGGRKKPVPHVRRAHWHTYWTGPRDGNRVPVLRWIPPTLVAAESHDDVAATIRRVK